MTTDVVAALDLLDLAVVRAEGVATREERATAAAVARRARQRRGLLGDTLVAALVGGTGSGKSSLLNAVAGVPVASVSAIRPHTDHPQAWTPETADPIVGRLLDELRIDDRVPNESLPGLALVDMPDMDSVVEWHRRTVEQILPRVDAVIWVFDPVKYNDPVLHEVFLAPLSRYRNQFVFVLNQVDRIADSEIAPVCSHLVGILEHGGFPEATVLATAAAPGAGEPRGIEELRHHLGERLDAKRIALGKLVEDVRGAAATLAASARVWDGATVGFEAQWSRLRSEMGPEEAARRIVASVAPQIGPTTKDRLLGALDRANGSVTEEDLRGPLWDRARLGATVASLGVLCSELASALTSRGAEGAPGKTKGS